MWVWVWAQAGTGQDFSVGRKVEMKERYEVIGNLPPLEGSACVLTKSKKG